MVPATADEIPAQACPLRQAGSLIQTNFSKNERNDTGGSLAAGVWVYPRTASTRVGELPALMLGETLFVDYRRRPLSDPGLPRQVFRVSCLVFRACSLGFSRCAGAVGTMEAA